MIGLVLATMILVFGVVWFVFMLPVEKGMHKKRMELLQRKLQQNEERLRREAEEQARAAANTRLEESATRKRASG